MFVSKGIEGSYQNAVENIFGYNSDTRSRIWTRLGGNASQESPAAFQSSKQLRHQNHIPKPQTNETQNIEHHESLIFLYFGGFHAFGGVPGEDFDMQNLIPHIHVLIRCFDQISRFQTIPAARIQSFAPGIRCSGQPILTIRRENEEKREEYNLFVFCLFLC